MSDAPLPSSPLPSSPLPSTPLPDTPPPDTAEQLRVLSAAEPYWIAQAMQHQGSRFYRALGLALEAADRPNRLLIYATWTAACWDFYQRGLRSEAQAKRGE